MKKAVILFSGGLDSATLLALVVKENYQIHTLSFDYGQRHSIEIKKSKIFLKDYSIKESKVLSIDPSIFLSSRLVGDKKFSQVDERRELEKDSPFEEEIPATYVPARNTLFLSYALAWAETLCAYHIFIGVNHLDYSGYPDCRPEYIEAFERMAQLATKTFLKKRIRIHTPLLSLTKAEIIALGLQLDVKYERTHSCYFPFKNGKSCKKCDSCLLREKGFKSLGAKDPL